MTPTTLIWVIVLIALVIWFQLQSLKDKALCSYIRPSRQKITKFVKLDEYKVIFDNKQFTILPGRNILVWYKLLWGMLGNIGTWIIGYEFTPDSEYPRDPSTYKSTVVNPETRRAMNNANSFGDFNRSVDKQSGRKSGLSQYMPYFVIGAIILVAGYYLYNQIAAQGAQIQAMKDALRLMNK